MGACVSPQEKSGNLSVPTHEVRLAATQIVRIAGMGGYHTSILLDDREYFFDSVGIMEAQPLWSHMQGEGKYPPEAQPKTEILVIGRSRSSGRAMAQALRPFFEKGSYDIFYKNCNSFSDAALYYLTRSRLSGLYSRIERLVTATNPLSVGLINRTFKAVIEYGGEHQGVCPDEIYVPNPRAQDFSIAEVIAALDAEDAEETDDSDRSGSDGSDSGSSPKSGPL